MLKYIHPPAGRKSGKSPAELREDTKLSADIFRHSVALGSQRVEDPTVSTMWHLTFRVSRHRYPHVRGNVLWLRLCAPAHGG